MLTAKKFIATLLLAFLLSISLTVVPVYAIECDPTTQSCQETEDAAQADADAAVAASESASPSSSQTKTEDVITTPAKTDNVQTSSNSTIKGCGMTDLTGETYSFASFVWAQIGTEMQKTYKDKDAFITNARIVELTESLPGVGTSVGGSILISAYKGQCCTKAKNGQCVDYANVYGSTLEECAANSQANDCRPIQLLISSNGINLLKFYILQLYIWGASVVGIIAVLVIVVSGIQIAASGGEDQLTSAKTRIMQSLAGLALLFLSGLVLYTINPTFFTN